MLATVLFVINLVLITLLWRKVNMNSAELALEMRAAATKLHDVSAKVEKNRQEVNAKIAALQAAINNNLDNVPQEVVDAFNEVKVAVDEADTEVTAADADVEPDPVVPAPVVGLPVDENGDPLR